MTLINFLFFIANLLLFLIGFYIMKKKIENLVINKEILDSIKKEINSMIVKLNETTVNNINLIEERASKLEKLIRVADKKASGLDNKVQENSEELEKFDIKFNELTYSPQKIVKQSAKTAENHIIEEKIVDIKELDLFDDELDNLTVNEKVKFLVNRGFEKEEIKRKIGLSSGELELIMNIENLKDY